MNDQQFQTVRHQVHGVFKRFADEAQGDTWLTRMEIWSKAGSWTRPPDFRKAIERMVQAGELDVRETDDRGRVGQEYRLVAVAQMKGGE